MKSYVGLKVSLDGHSAVVERVRDRMLGGTAVTVRYLDGPWGGCRETVAESRLVAAERPIASLAGGAA